MDELVEKIARAISPFLWEDDGFLTEEIKVWMRETARQQARDCLSIIEAEVGRIYDKAMEEYPDCLDGSDFEEFSVRVCELFAAAPKPPTPSATGK